ncbi:MAG: aminotransferase class V-fold PLP-dependent enzyme [Hymenobacter sp.]
MNYYTGQVFDMAAITRAGHAVGATVGFDLAHAAGNVVLHLHDWDVDFACWCTYKYMNSGPGGTSGVFVHERFANRPDLPRLAGWWGNDPEERFEMKKASDRRRARRAGSSRAGKSCRWPCIASTSTYSTRRGVGRAARQERKADRLPRISDSATWRCLLPSSKSLPPPTRPRAAASSRCWCMSADASCSTTWPPAASWPTGASPTSSASHPCRLYNSFEDVRRVGAALLQDFFSVQ